MQKVLLPEGVQLGPPDPENWRKMRAEAGHALSSFEAWSRRSARNPEWWIVISQSADDPKGYCAWFVKRSPRSDQVAAHGWKPVFQEAYREAELAAEQQPPIRPSLPESVRLFVALLETETDPELTALEDRHRPHVHSMVHWHREVRGQKVAKLSYLQVQRGAPSGAGTAFMQELCDWADRNGVILTLEADAIEGTKDWKKTTSRDRLKGFYRRFGFVSSYGKRTYRPDLSGNMHRHPA